MTLLFSVHILFMALGAACFLFSLIIVLNRKRFKGTWLSRHKKLNLAGLLSILTGFLFIFLYVRSYGGTHFLTVHSRLGVITLTLLTITLILMQWAMKRKKTGIIKIHPWGGRLSLSLLLLTLILGLSLII